MQFHEAPLLDYRINIDTGSRWNLRLARHLDAMAWTVEHHSVVTAFESVFDETPFVERKPAVRAAIFESDDRAVNFSEENHGLVQ